MNTSFTVDNNTDNTKTETNTVTEHTKNETPRQTLTNDAFTTALNTLEFVHNTDKPMEEVGKNIDDETEIKKKITDRYPIDIDIF